MPFDMLYYVSGKLEMTCGDNSSKAMDNVIIRPLPVKLVTHEVADKFIISASNLPWIKTPVSYIEGDKIYVVYDSINIPNKTKADKFELIYISKPNTFVKDTQKFNIPTGKFATFFDYSNTLADNNIYAGENVLGNMKYS
jgi:hypothetical protein